MKNSNCIDAAKDIKTRFCIQQILSHQPLSVNGKGGEAALLRRSWGGPWLSRLPAGVPFWILERTLHEPAASPNRLAYWFF
jgi:hypothetical protein